MFCNAASFFYNLTSMFNYYLFMSKIRFIFVWRLSKEKGFGEVLRLIDTVSVDPDLASRMHIDVFGDGVMKSAIESSSNERNFVDYHWHQPKEKVLATRSDCHYTLMPSHFLETFGLSALDSLQLAKPVVAYEKWGLAQFAEWIVPISTSWLTHTVLWIIDSYSEQSYMDASLVSKKVYDSYSRERWLSQFELESELSPWSTVLIVNDYGVDIWWLENRLWLMVSKLSAAGYHVQRYGSQKKKYWIGRFFDLLWTIGNVQAYFWLKKIVTTIKPDLVRFHSVHRWLWWLPLLAVPRECKQRLMSHDFGMFHPYPSLVFDENQVLKTTSFRWFWRESQQCWYVLPLVFAKRCSLRILFWMLRRNINSFFVPSSYMNWLVSKHMKKPVSAFPHFV